MAVEICTDIAAAGRRRGAGADVVLILAEGVAFAGAGGGAADGAGPDGAGDAGSGRLAVFVADASWVPGGSAEVVAAAMGRELWGG